MFSLSGAIKQIVAFSKAVLDKLSLLLDVLWNSFTADDEHLQASVDRLEDAVERCRSRYPNPK